MPARVRGDFGTKNTDLASFRSVQDYEGAYIQGPSVHNQRIERLDYDATNSLFVNLFLFMENIFVLERTNFIDIFCIHTIFLSRIQRTIDEFRDGWNDHPLSRTKKYNSVSVEDGGNDEQKTVRTTWC